MSNILQFPFHIMEAMMTLSYMDETITLNAHQASSMNTTIVFQHENTLHLALLNGEF